MDKLQKEKLPSQENIDIDKASAKNDIKKHSSQFTKLTNSFKRMSTKRKIISITLMTILLVVVFIAVSNYFKKPGYTTDRVAKSNITEIVTESGAISTNGRIDIYSPTNGIIKDIFVSNDEEITEGQELFSVESSAAEQEQQAANANYLTAVSALGTAQATMYSLQSAMFEYWNTYKNLAENSTYENDDNTPKTENRTLPEFHIAEKNWLAAETKYKNQQSVVAQAQAQVSATWILYQATQNAIVKAPAAGTVSNLSVIPGSSVVPTSLLAPTTPILSIGNFITTEVMVSLGENEITKVKEGQNANIEVDAVDGKTYKGIVRRVNRIGTITQNVIKYNVYVEISNPDLDLRPGMSADVDITTQEIKNILSVPNSAIKPYEGGKAVRVPGAKKGEIDFIPVQIGIKGKKNTQIIKGLSEGQTVITSLSNEEVKRESPFGF
ncbi:MAG: efflux RND transporter periplasmic adaptor subunit [Patescibacteria group bacterium]